MRADKLQFGIKDVIQIVSTAAMFVMQYYSLKSDIKELVLYRKEDEKFFNARLARIEQDVQKHSNMILNLQLGTRAAILPESPKITSDAKPY